MVAVDSAAMGSTRRNSDTVSDQFLELVRKEMEKQGLSNSALARKMGVPHQTVSELLNHPGVVRSTTIVKWCAALGVEPILKGRRIKP